MGGNWNISRILQKRFCLDKEYTKCFLNEKEDSKLTFITYYFSRYEEFRKVCSSRILSEVTDEVEFAEITASFTKYKSDVLEYLVTLGKPRVDSEETCFKYAGLLKTFIGLAFEIGALNFKVDLKKAKFAYKQAARLKNPLGTFRLAQFYERYSKKTGHAMKSVDYYRCAAKLGSIEACHVYGVISVFGELGSLPDLENGIFFLDRAVKLSTRYYPYACYDLARFYECEQVRDTPLYDPITALKLYTKGAELGCTNCMFRLGKCFEVGDLGIEQNLWNYYRNIESAATLGHSGAQMHMSSIFLTGIEGIVEPDAGKSFTWVLRSAANGNVNAVYSLGLFHEKGIGVKIELSKAYFWYHIAAENGNIGAKARVTELEAVLKSKNIHLNRKKRWWFM